ncbi:MAG: AI-2E family transporter [Verrucomicrobiales bacterium]
MPKKFQAQSASQVVLTAAGAAVLIGALKLSEAFFVPILLAAFIATVSFPITSWLRRHRVPRFFAVLLTVLVDFAFLTGIILFGISLAGDLQDKWKGEDGQPGYEELMWEKIQIGTDKLNATLASWGFEDASVNIDLEEALKAEANKGEQGNSQLMPPTVAEHPAPTGFLNSDRIQEQFFRLDVGKVLDLSTNVAFGILSFLGSSLLILILTIFMLTEARMFGRQVKAICEARGPDLQRMLSAAKDVQRYLAIKTIISLATGVLAGFLCWAAGIDLFVLWGILAFLLNYIPVVGSIIAGVPPVLLALLVEDGVSAAVAIAIGFTAINVFLGNFLEPMLMGRRFGLSTLVVLIAVLFWGWLWGPVGMLLAVPLTMVLKVALDNSEEFRWLAVAISKEKEGDQQALREGENAEESSYSEDRDASPSGV